MTLIVSASKFKSRFQISTSDKMDASVLEVLEATTVHVAEHLRTDLTQDTYADKFCITPGLRSFGAQGAYAKLLLNSGFVINTLVTPVVISYASTYQDLLDNPSTLSDTCYIVDTDKGIISIMTLTDDNGQTMYPSSAVFFEVSYTAGFTSSAAPDALGTVYDDTPAWLQEGAMGLAKHLFYTARQDSKKQDTVLVPPSVLSLLSTHVRTSAGAYTPIG